MKPRCVLDLSSFVVSVSCIVFVCVCVVKRKSYGKQTLFLLVKLIREAQLSLFLNWQF